MALAARCRGVRGRRSGSDGAPAAVSGLPRPADLLVGVRALRPAGGCQPADLDPSDEVPPLPGDPCAAALLPAAPPAGSGGGDRQWGGARPTAKALAVPQARARDWRRRHRARAPNWLARAEALVVELGGELPRW